MNQIKKGIYPTMITPYDEAGKVDMNAVRRIVEWYVENGVDGIFAVCQSSEMFFLTEDERAELAAEVVGKSRGEKLMDLRKKMQMPGRHPGCKKCKNLGTENCRCKHNAEKKDDHVCTCGSKGADSDLVAEITRRVLAALGK